MMSDRMRRMVSDKMVAAQVIIVALGACGTHSTSAQPPDGGTTTQIAGDKTPAPVITPLPAAPVAPKPVAPPANVRIVIRAVPQAKKQKTEVYWGKRLLGETPFVLERAQGSGPLDLTLKSEGFFNVHVRAYTDKSEALVVPLTRLADRMTLFGARKELPPEDAPPAEGTPAPPAPVATPPAK